MEVETLLVVDLNACLTQPRFEQEEDLVTAIANHGLSEHSLHFIPRQRYRVEVGWSWRMWRDGRIILGRGDYIIGMYHRDFYKLGVSEPRM